MPTLSIDIEARLAQFQDGLNKVARDAGRTANSIDRAFSGLRSTLAGIGVGLTLGAIAGAIKQTIVDLGDLNDAAAQAGISVESLSSLLNTLKPTGIGLQEIIDLTGKIVRAMQQAENATSAQAEAFEKLGVKTKDAAGNLRDPANVLYDIAAALSRYKDDANKVAIAQALLTKTGASYLPVLGDLASRGRAAASVTKEQAQAADDLADSVRELGVQWDIFKQKIVGSWLPDFVDALARFNKLTDLTGGNLFERVQIGTGLADAGAQLEEASRKVETYTAAIAKLDRQIAEGERAKPPEGEGLLSRVMRTSDLETLRRNREQLQEQLEFQRKRQTYAQFVVDQSKPKEPQGPDARPATPKVKRAEGGSSAKLKEAAREFEDFEARVNAAVARLIQDAPIVKAQELEAVIGRLNTLFQQGLNGGVYAGALEEALTGLVQNGVDATQALDILDNAFFELGLSAEAYDKIQKAIFRTTETAGQDGAAGLRDLADRWRDAIDPMREYARQVEEIKRLEGRGFLTPEEAGRARAIVQDRADKELSGATDQTKDLTDAAKDLGITFSSAFEDAVVSGKGLRDVLSGLEQDIMRIVTRKLVTEPLANAISGIGTSLLGGLFGGSAAPITASIPTYVKANGGIITEFGEVPLRKYAVGGVARSPQAAIFGEGSTPEAYVPLPDGRTIPVTMQGGSGDVNINVYAQDVESFRRSEGQIKARVAGWSAGAGRFR